MIRGCQAHLGESASLQELAAARSLCVLAFRPYDRPNVSIRCARSARNLVR